MILVYGLMAFLKQMNRTKRVSFLITLFLLVFMVACQKDSLPKNAFIHIYDMTVNVDELKEIVIQTNLESTEGILFTTDSQGILIDDGSIYGLKSGTTNTVNVTYKSLKTSFKVIVFSDQIDVVGSLFDDVTITPIESLENRDDFIMGVDISSVVEVIKRGGKYYDQQGIRTSIYQLLMDAGVNYIRIRLWNDPVSPTGIPYGGGNNDLSVAKEIGHRAKMFGMKILLNFHYSDFWADPGKQIIPKAWANLTTATEISEAIYNFTYEAMEEMDEAGAKVDMVQIGNEIAPGMITQGTSDYETINTATPNRFNLSPSISGSTSNINNLVMYLNAGLDAARAQNPDVLTMIHIDRGGNNSFYRNFYDRLAEHQVDYDIIGMSYYVFYHGALENFQNNINDIAERYQKKVVVAETSYAFTNQPFANTSHILTSSYFDYPLSPQGQVDVMHDIIKIVSDVENQQGLGIFYWEPAWLPVPGAGWAGSSSPITWANQAFFSYQGIALPSLELFKSLIPNS
jgi:arabinogalactan endo-1,4-beta-galactosidase